jgi:hypothetical protein
MRALQESKHRAFELIAKYSDFQMTHIRATLELDHIDTELDRKKLAEKILSNVDLDAKVTALLNEDVPVAVGGLLATP